jgi:polysaccharide biosynthesis/export protein
MKMQIHARVLGLCAFCAVFQLVMPRSNAQQTDNTGTPQSTVPVLHPSRSVLLRAFEPDANEEYTLGAGDEISVELPGHTELSGKHVIGPDGRITLDVAGPIEIANLNRETAAKQIVAALAPYYADLTTATVQVDHYGSNHVLLLGNVQHPGEIEFDQVPTLLEAISRGGIVDRPDGSVPEECVIYRGDQVVWVDLQDLLETGDPLANLRLRRNDIVFVPAHTDRVVSVIGQVEHPGAVILKRDSTVASVIGEAGGPTDAAGGNPEIEIVHKSKGGATQYLHFKDLLKPSGGLEIALNPGDIVYVPKSGMAKLGFALQQIGPIAVFGTVATFMAH